MEIHLHCQAKVLSKEIDKDIYIMFCGIWNIFQKKTVVQTILNEQKHKSTLQQSKTIHDQYINA